MQTFQSDSDSSSAATQQMIALREAALAIAADLSHADTLKRIVSAAAQLVNARYAALGVPDDTGELLVEFITVGMTAEAEARISHRPRGHGILGVILREQQSLRLRNLGDHPRSVGFPANHPPMTSFLGVPVLYKGQSVGNLYLTDKRDAEEFTEADLAIIELLASHAALAIQNTRLYEVAVARNRELTALNAVATATGRYLDLDQVMSEALDHVLALTRVEVGRILLRDEANGDLTLALHRGPFAQAFGTLRRFKSGEGFPSDVTERGQPLLFDDLTAAPYPWKDSALEAGFHAYVSIPLLSQDKAVGTLDLAAFDAAKLDPAILGLLENIGRQIGVAVENARLHQQVGRLAVLEERQRIGMDLHDGIIQSIFAVGLTLNYIHAQMAEGGNRDAGEQVKSVIDSLDAITRDIRAYILDLRPRRFAGDDLIESIQLVLGEFRANKLIPVTFQADSGVNAKLTHEARLGLFHILQEAVSNATKHSRASQLDVQLRDEQGSIVLSIKDNGRGFDPGEVKRRVGHGLMNMRDRASALGGELIVHSQSGQGTEVRVSIPV